MPELVFVLPGLVLGTVSNVLGAGGTGKSFVMLVTALGVGIGKDFAGIWGKQPTKGKVVLLSFEDVAQELQRRLHLFRNDVATHRDDADENVEIVPAAGHAAKRSE